MTSKYHAGELAVQTRAGVQVEAERLGKMIGSSIQPGLILNVEALYI